MTDNEIVAHLAEGRYVAALRGVYSLMPEVRKFIIHNSGTVQDAEDIFQDALVVLCRKVKTADFRLTAPLKSFLMGIVKNCWLQELRQRKRMPQGESTAEIAEVQGSIDELTYVTAKEAFNALGEKCKRLLIMFYFNKKSYREIAVELSFSDENTAKNQKYRCLQKAKEHYSSLIKMSSHA